MATHIAPSDSRAPAETTAIAGDDAISPMDVLIVLAERKRFILGVTAAFAIAAVILALVLPKHYTATATLLPPQQSSSMSGMLLSQIGSTGGLASLAGGGLSLKNPNEMFVAMLKSRTVEDAMVQRFDLMREYRSRFPSDARKSFEKHASIDGTGKDGLIRISMEDRDPKRAAGLANGYIDEFRKLSEHLAITEASQRRLFFENQLEQAKDNLANAEEAMKQTEQKTGLIQLDSQTRALIESAASLRAQIVAKEVQIQSLGTFATSENSQLVQAKKELESLQAQLTKLSGGEGDSDTSLVPNGKVPEAGIEYVRKLRDVKYYETIFDILARQFEMAKLDEAKQGALIQVVDTAIPPDRASFPRLGLFGLFGLVGGLILGILAAFAQTAVHNLKQDPLMSHKVAELLKALSIRNS